MAFFPWRKRKKPDLQPVFQPVSEDAALGYRTAVLHGQGSRENQEDAFALVNHQDIQKRNKMGLLALVADGMGGMQDGKLASETAVSCLCNAFCQDAPLEEPAQWLEQSLQRTGGQIQDLLNGLGGCTMVACLVYQKQLWFACVGDSFLYLLRNGELNRLNRFHTVKQSEFLAAIASGSMDPERGKSHPESHALTSFLGMQGLLEVDCLRSPMPLKAGDTLLMCSDGVGGVLEEAEILYCLNKSEPEECCAAIEQYIRNKARLYQDNYTALVIQCIQ